MKVPESTSPPLAVRDLPGPPFVPAWPGEEPPLSGERKERAEGLQIHLARPDGTLFRHLLLLGRVMSGTGGELIRESTAAKLRELTTAFASELQFTLPTEREKRHGQAIAAASLVPDNRIASAILS